MYTLYTLYTYVYARIPVDATIGNQAFSHDGCYISPGLSYNKANDAFLNNLRKNSVEAQVEFASKVMERAKGQLLLMSQLRMTLVW